MGNWDMKEKLKVRAIEHTKEMEMKYAQEIRNAVGATMIYPDKEGIYLYVAGFQSVLILETDAVSAIIDNKKGLHTAVLNFASYKNPGGMFIEGAKAQEEMLCHESYLYNVLREFKDDYYLPNIKRLNKALYNDNLLFSPHIRFMRNESSAFADVITCAAPNKKAAQKYQGVSDDEVNRAMRERIRRILSVALLNNVEQIILGAYGCGVFGNSPKDVANIFLEEFSGDFKECFQRVIFAIPGGENYKVFKEILSKLETSQ